MKPLGNTNETLATLSPYHGSHPSFYSVPSQDGMLIMLIHHSEPDGHDLYFEPEFKAQSMKGNRIWIIRRTKQALDYLISKHLLFIHSVLG